MREAGIALYLKKVFIFLYEHVEESKERGSRKPDDIPKVAVNLTDQ